MIRKQCDKSIAQRTY